jgi:tetratricopeptide (TPR) repeat protein
MTTLFISHSSEDDDFVRDLQRALAEQNVDAWIDSRELRGGDALEPALRKAIKDRSALAVVVSTDSLQSAWVADELDYAIRLQKRRGKDKYPVIPITSEPGGIEAALNAILVALGKRLPAETPSVKQPEPAPEPLEELVLHLTDLGIHEQDGVRRPSARAQLVYQPATPGRRSVSSSRSWRFVAPIGLIEADELRWYLEKYAVWPSTYFQERARRVEQSLATWGQLLYQAALPPEYTATVMQAWSRVGNRAGRRFSVYVNPSVEAEAPEADQLKVAESATLLLSLPWEILHDGKEYVFRGAKPTQVRRRLPNTGDFEDLALATPIRILLVVARPEDDACGYFDHRSSALPLVAATEALGGLIRVQILTPPALPALHAELERARQADEPYHVLHFDGHGVYDRHVGLGGLCFEDPQDIGKLEQRRRITVYPKAPDPSKRDDQTSDVGLGLLLRAYRIPLVFLDACQTAQAGQTSGSVATELLNDGVASVVAMSHSVLVETATRFVEAFYGALASGARVGDAMLAGQRELKDDSFRGQVFGAGALRLQDWFVPVLFQEEEDPRLFRTVHAPRTRQDLQVALAVRQGALPDPPETGFVGRSRELLALERLLSRERYAVVRGQGGEGKTALAAELARWMVRSHQVHRAAFVSVETHSTATAVLDAIGRQLVPSYSVATFENLEQAVQPVERALDEQPTLLVVDNMESILLPPFLEAETPDALDEEMRRELDAILALCARLNKVGNTRLAFTSREALPAPFDAQRNRRALHQLDREDAVKLVERALNEDPAGPGAAGDARREEIEQLVVAVNRHARTLALLATSLRSRGVAQTRASLVDLMAEMERRFPGSREKSVYASVQLSLDRMSPANRDRARVLGLFHGGVQLGVLRMMMGWDDEDVASLARELIETGLATLNPYNHLTLNPALCPYLRGLLDSAERAALTTRWGQTVGAYVQFLDRAQHRDAELAATLTALELPNLFALLDCVQGAGDPEATIDLTTALYVLLQQAGRPRLLERVGAVRDAAAEALGEAWTHARFQVQRTRVEQQLGSGAVGEAIDGAQRLLERARAAAENSYPGAAYDLALACNLLGQVLHAGGRTEQALPLLDEAQHRFETINRENNRPEAERMARVCIGRRGDCLLALRRLDEAAATFEECVQRAKTAGDDRK